MTLLKWFSLTALLAFGMGCIAPERTDSEVEVTIQASFEKQVLTSSGFSGVVTKPARYCYAEIRQSNPDQLLASDFLGSDGTVSAYIPRGMKFYVQVFAEVGVPSTSPNETFFYGSVRDGLAPSPGSDYTTQVQSLTGTRYQGVATNDFIADRSVSVPILVRGLAGAFNIADQMASFALKVRELEPSLRLPSLHAYWTNGDLAPSQYLLYPQVISDESRNLVYRETVPITKENRAVFTAAFPGQPGGAAGADTDEFDDAVLQHTFYRLLFADRSKNADGSNWAPLFRRDNDNVNVSRYRQSESTAAFVGGACDFLAAATLGNSRLLDSYNDASGVFRVDTFDLAFHDPFLDSSEFTRGSIAVSLWGIYQNSLGGSASGLQTLWNALRSNTRNADDTGEYNRATLACYPSYLLGVKSRVSGTQWNSALGELGLENIPDPSPAYFNGTALYQPINIGQSVNGSVQAYQADDFRYYDRNQSQAYRFNLYSPSTRTVQMIPTGGQDLFLEVLGPDGWEGGSTDGTPGSTRTLTLPSLPAGAYAIRVRAGYTTATTNAGFTLTLQ